MLANKRLVAAASALFATAYAPQSMGQIEQTIHLQAVVPVLCSVHLQQSAGQSLPGAVYNLGVTQEFCNSPRGYRVILQHPEHMVGAAVISDTARIPLNESGETVVTDSDQPAIESRHLALDLGDDPQQINRLGLRIEVKY